MNPWLLLIPFGTVVVLLVAGAAFGQWAARMSERYPTPDRRLLRELARHNDRTGEP